MICETALAACAGLGLELVHEVDDVEEAAAGAATDAGADDADGEMRLAGAGAADQNQVALVGEDLSAGEVADQRLVDRRAIEDELLDLLREGQLGNGELVLDRSRLLLADLRRQQVADDLSRGSCFRFTAVAMISS